MFIDRSVVSNWNVYVRVHLASVHSPLLFGKIIRIESVPVRAAILGCLGFIYNEGLIRNLFSELRANCVAFRLFTITLFVNRVCTWKKICSPSCQKDTDNLSRFARAKSAFRKLAYSWQNSGLHEAPPYPRTRFCSGGKRQKTGSMNKGLN